MKKLWSDNNNEQDVYSFEGKYFSNSIYNLYTDITVLKERIAELERHIRHIEKPQFWMSEGGDFSGGSFCCNHCSFSSNLFADRDEHIKSCVGREDYLSGKEQG